MKILLATIVALLVLIGFGIVVRAATPPSTVPQGGTGWGAVQTGGLLYGNTSLRLATTTQGTGGFVLSWLNGIPSWIATTTFSGGLLYASGNVTATLGTSIDLATEVTGDLPFANLTQGAANTVLVNQTSATADFTVLATSTFANGLYAGTAGQVLARLSNGTWAGVATTTFSSGLTYSAGNVTADLGTSITPGELSATISANNIPYVNSAGSAFVSVATSSLNLGVSGGGTGATTLTGILIGNGTGAFTADAVPLNVSNGGTGLTTFGGVNSVLFTTAADTLTHDASNFIYNTSVDGLGLGTSTPRWALTISSSTASQLVLTDASLTNVPWNFRAINNFLYISTSSPSTFATSTLPALSINSTGAASLSVGSTTQTLSAVQGLITQGSNGVNGSSTMSVGKWQIDGYNSAGTRSCAYIVGTAWVISAGACNP